jgi:hypothetical protein
MFQDDMHQYYTDEGRHWHPLSERYTGADSLLTLLKANVQMLGRTVYCQHFPLSEFRNVTIFHIYIQYQGDIQHLRIIDTPYLHRLLSIYKMSISHLEGNMTYPMVMQSLELSHQKIA